MNKDTAWNIITDLRSDGAEHRRIFDLEEHHHLGSPCIHRVWPLRLFSVPQTERGHQGDPISGH